MARGFIGGALMGTIVSVGVAGVASVIFELPNPPDVADAAPNSVSGASAGSDSDVDAVKTDADLVQSSTGSVAQPDQDDVAAVAEAGSDVSQQPQTGGAEGLNAPEAANSDSSVVVDGESPVSPSPQTSVPVAPEGETELSISTDPAQPPAPEVPESETAFEQPETTEETVVVETPAEEAPAEEAEIVEAETVDVETVETETVIDPIQPDPPAAEEQSTGLPTATDTAPADDRPKIGRPAGSLVNIEEPAEAEAETVAEEAETAADELPPLQAFALPFENADDKPLMSIVLIDAGDDLSESSVGLPALRSFPAPITFAVDASLPDAAERMKNYRSAGFEVLAMIDLPTGATATDAEVSLNSVLSAMNEVVGVIEGIGNGVQEVREASDQVTQILLSSGHGFVTQSKGLNTVAKLAAREGVPTATVFRDFDSADQSPTVIRRFLDQAAFRAGQEGGVIMMGRLRPDTISALLLWGLQDRASRVALAPVSAVLSKQ